MSIATTDKINALWRGDIDPLKTRMTTAEGNITDLHNVATTSTNGLMSSTDKQRVDNYANILNESVILRSTDWALNSEDKYAQSVTISNFSAYNSCDVHLPDNATSSQIAAAMDAELEIEEKSDHTGLIFTVMGTKPTINIPLVVSFGTSMNVVSVPKVLNDTGGGGSSSGSSAYYGTCITSGSTAAKEVTTYRSDFELETGADVIVKFTNSNTASNVTLNIDDTGAVPVYFNGIAITANVIDNKASYEFVYNGTQFDLVGKSEKSEEITYAQYQQLTPQQKADGTTRYIPDYPGLGGVYIFNTVAAMAAAIANGDVPENAICITDEDTPYVVDAGDVDFDNTGTDLAATDVEGAIKEVDGKVNPIVLATSEKTGTQGSKVGSLASAINALPVLDRLRVKILQYQDDSIIYVYTNEFGSGVFISLDQVYDEYQTIHIKRYRIIPNDSKFDVFIDSGQGTGTLSYYDYSNGPNNTQHFQAVLF